MQVGLVDVGRAIRDILLRRDMGSPLDALEERSADVFEWRMLGRTYLALRHPDHVEHVLVAGHDRYVKAKHYRLLAAVTGEGLLTNEGESWAHQRRLIQPLLGRRELARLGDHMTAAASDHLRRWDEHQDGDVIDVSTAMTDLTLDVVGRALFGTTLADTADRLRPAVGLGLDTAVGAARIQSLLSLPRWSIDLAGTLVMRAPVLPPKVRRIQRAMRTIDGVVRDIVAERMADPATEGTDMVGLLLGARDVVGNAMSSTQVRDELVTFMLAGHETTANAMSWLWYLLAQHPGARDRLRDEVDTVVDGQAATAAHADRLPWTAACVQEALRLYPPAWILEREAVTDDELDGYRIRRGTTVHLPIYSVHRDERWWPDPLRFDPERFLGASDRARPRGAYLPFGAGRRTCVGSQFALLEATLIAATVAQRYDLDLVDGTPVEPEATVTLRPKGGLPMRLRRRA
ncbi:MAG: cytochrome P450 [Acidimicrobiales bacterium]